MLTRSASKRQAGSPAKSVNNTVKINSSDNNITDSNKVNIKFVHDNNNDQVCAQNIELNFHIMPPNVDVTFDSNGFVQIVTFNLPRVSVTAQEEPVKTINFECSPPSVTIKTNLAEQKKTSNDKTKVKNCTNESYAHFNPKITSSARKRSRIQQEDGENIETMNRSVDLVKSVYNKKKKDRFSDDELKQSRNSSFFKGVVVNGEFSADDFKKAPVVKLVPVSNEEIKAWRTPKKVKSVPNSKSIGESSSSHSSSSIDLNGNYSESSFKYRMVQVKSGMGEKCTDACVMRMSKKRKPTASSTGVTNSSKKLLVPSSDGHRESCNVKDGRDVESGEPPDGINRDLRGVVFGKVPSDSRNTRTSCTPFNSEVMERYMKSIGCQNSVVTGIFEEETEKPDESSKSSGITLPKVDDIPKVVVGIIDRLALPNDRPDGESEVARNEEGTERGEGEVGGVTKGGLTEGKRQMDFYEIYSDGDEINTNAETESPGWDYKRAESVSEMNCSFGCSAGNCVADESGEGKRNEVTVETLRLSDKWEMGLRQIQLECIKKELEMRAEKAKTSTGKKRSKTPGKSGEKVAGLSSARKTRQRRRIFDDSSMLAEDSMEREVKKTPKGRNSIGKGSTEERENAFEKKVTSTPRSRRIKSLRNQTPETIERKRRMMEEVSATPKGRGKILKLSQTEVETKNPDEGKDEASPTRRTRDGGVDGSVEKGDSSVSSPKKSISPKKTSQMEVPEETAKENEEGETEVVSSPKSRKSQSPVKGQAEDRVECAKDSGYDERVMESLSSPLKKKKEAAERLRAEEERLGQKQMKEVEVALTSSQSPKKVSSPMKSRTVEEESSAASTPRTKKTRNQSKSPVELEVLEDGSCGVEVNTISVGKEKSKSPRKEFWATEGNDSDVTEMWVPPSREGKRRKSRKKQHGERLEPEEGSSDEEMSMTPSAEIEKRKSPKKQHSEKDGSRESDGREYMCAVSFRKQKKLKSPREEDVEVFLPGGRDSDDPEMMETSPERGKEEESRKERSDGVSRLSDAESPREERSELLERVSKRGEDSVASPPEEEVAEKDESGGREEVEELMAALSSQRAVVKSRTEGASKKRRRKEEEKRRRRREDGYIPLNASGATKFSVVELDKLKRSAPAHPAFDLKTSLIYGSRIKRVPYSQIQAYKMKVKSRKMRG